MNGSVCSTTSTGTGFTARPGRASQRPGLSGSTDSSSIRTLAETSSCDAAHLNIRHSRRTCAFVYVTPQPRRPLSGSARIMSSRRRWSRRGPNAAAGVEPYARRSRRISVLQWLRSFSLRCCARARQKRAQRSEMVIPPSGSSPVAGFSKSGSNSRRPLASHSAMTRWYSSRLSGEPCSPSQ